MNNFSDYNLILLPGLDGTGLLFEPFLNILPNSEQVIVIKYPSDKKLDYDQLASYVKEQIPSKNFILLAESFSGPIVTKLLKHTQLSAIILCASFLNSPRPILTRIVSYCPSCIFKLRLPSFILRFFCFGRDCSYSTITLFYKAISLVNPSVLKFRLKLLSQINEIPNISNLAIPFYYLMPSDDLLVPKSCAQEILKAQKSLVIKKIEGAHFIMQSSPKESAKVIFDICNSISKDTGE